MRYFAPMWVYVDALLHPAALGDPLTAARHRAFIAPRLIVSLTALAAFPVYIAMRGRPSALEVGVFAWLMTPMLIAYFLSRTGRYERAQTLSSLSLAGLVTMVAWATGGIESFAAVWLVVVPLEAALSASRRAVASAAGFALLGAGLLMAAGAFGFLPSTPNLTSHPGTFTALGLVAASLYAAVLAFGAAQMARASSGLRDAGEERYRLLSRNMIDVVTRHGRNGALLYASPSAEALFGMPVAALAGHGLFERVQVADRPAYLSALADAAGGEERSVELRIRRGGDAASSGAFVWVEMLCRPYAEAGAREAVAVMREIGERKAQARAIEIARAESERANAAKSRFLATMSHELRTPLNAIIGFSDMLGSDELALTPERAREYAGLINESGRHLLSVVNGILDMSKMDSGNFEMAPESFAPGQAVTSCCDLLALKAQEAGVVLATRIDAALPEIVADRRAFNQILINLVSNAIKFTPREGRVTVGAVAEGGDLVIGVEDTGVGIDEDDLPRLGEAFFQARTSYDRRHDGTGLGLSIVKGLVHLHGGDVTIRSRLGEGTRVSVRLPIAGEEDRPAAAPIELNVRRAEEPAKIVKTGMQKIA